MSTPTPRTWKYLDRKPRSRYRQLVVKGRNIFARTLYGAYVSETFPRTPEQIAEDFALPLEAVREAIAYCASDPPEIRLDWQAEELAMELTGMNDPDYKYHPERYKPLSPEDLARIESIYDDLPGR